MTNQRHQLAALAALRALREAWAWLPEVEDAATIPGQQRRAAVQTQQVIARRGTQYAAELAERHEDRSITPAAAHPMPIRPALVDARAAAYEALVDAAWIVASALHRRPTHWAVTPAGDASPVWWPRTRLFWPSWDAAGVHLQLALPSLTCDRTCPRASAGHRPHPGCWWHREAGCAEALAEEVAGQLTRADEHLREVLGAGPAWIRLPYQVCPKCRRRSIEAEVSSLAERDWSIRCEHGCLMSTVEDYGRRYHKLADLLALIRSVRRQGQKRVGRVA